MDSTSNIDDHSGYQEIESDTVSSPSENLGNHSSKSSSFSLARKETRAVEISKYFLVVVLFVSTLTVGLITFKLLSAEEQDNFESKFYDSAIEISELVHFEAKNVFLSASTLSAVSTSYALDMDATWPFVSIPHFEVRGSDCNAISNSLLTAFCPLVPKLARAKWSTYSVENQNWIEEGVNSNIELHEDFVEGRFKADSISKAIFRYENGKQVVEKDEGPYLPVWQLAPAPHDNHIINYNLLSNPVFSRVYHEMLQTEQAVLSEVIPLDFLYGGSIRDDVTHPHSFLLQPIYKDFSKIRGAEGIVGTIILILPWDQYFMNLLPEGSNGILVVLGDTCGQNFTYIINGREATYVGPGDLHDSKYDRLVFRTDFDVDHHLNTTKDLCEFFLNIYPTSQLEEKFLTNRPLLFTLTVISVFAFTSMIFIMYDYLVERRQQKVMVTAKRSNAVVSALFPSNVWDRMMKQAQHDHETETNGMRSIPLAQKSKIKSFLERPKEEIVNVFESKPIADLFPSATVMFGDLVGFTAWSSVREPSQVFQLLETIYHAFDEIARRRQVFKVETVGDCYVAVSGLPEPRHDHAIVMARFAKDCLSKTTDLAKKLEVTLGPDTADICMRVGLNSGPVTAGVLRGDKSRFQLFGDTVNTAARMESNGRRNRIHISQETANLLQAAGKSHWLSQREDKVFAKGKGELQTYWLELKAQTSPSSTSETLTSSSNDIIEAAVFVRKSALKAAEEESQKLEQLQNSDKMEQGALRSVVERIRGGLTRSVREPLLSDKVERLVGWTSDVLERMIKQIVARRNAYGVRSRKSTSFYLPLIQEGATVLDEVKEIIELPQFDAKAARNQGNPDKVSLDPEVTTQLRKYIAIIATMYSDNPFHNFEHASHVTMSVVKLLSRIVSPDDILTEGDEASGNFDRNLHDQTYGITSDPLTQFAVVFSAIIHDVDHPGVPNSQLVLEQTDIAEIYKNKSVAEQNSVDIAWDLLMKDSFASLRSVIYTNQSELKRFRQLIVNSVMATDIVDKELKVLRNGRWDKAFKSSDLCVNQSPEDVNRRATIVIEHLIQASDIAHTMQHWHVYRKWNERLFHEMHQAYQSGRAEKNPAEFWYEGEIAFFDFYIIPLARKLKDCGVFGVSCDELLNYAMANRKEWEIKGKGVVAAMAKKYGGKRFSYYVEQCKLCTDDSKSNSFDDKF